MIKHKDQKIVFAIRDILAIGGAQLNALRLAKDIHERDCSVFILGQGSVEEIRRHLCAFGLDNTIPILPVHTPKGILKKIVEHFPNSYFWIPCFYKLWKIRNQFNILHCPLLMESIVICALTEMFLGKPSIIKIGSGGRYGDVSRAARNKMGWFVRLLIKRITMFVCLTKEIELELSSELGIPNNKLIRIPNGIDLDVYHPVTRDQKEVKKKSLGINASKKLVLFVGRLEHKKRVDFLLKAWKIVQADKRISANLLIVGDGSLRMKLEIFKNQLKVCDTVTFHGESENIAHLMQSADVFVLPSVSEGLANVFLEAMSSGLPIIATNTTGNAEILSHKANALLFPEKSHRELADHILYLLKDDKTAQNIGLSARKTVEERFNVQKIAGQYSQLYQDLIEYYTAG